MTKSEHPAVADVRLYHERSRTTQEETEALWVAQKIVERWEKSGPREGFHDEAGTPMARLDDAVAVARALLSSSKAARGMMTRDQVANEIARYAEGLVPETRGVAVWLEHHFRGLSSEDIAALSPNRPQTEEK